MKIKYNKLITEWEWTVITICKTTQNRDTHMMESINNYNCGRDSKQRTTKMLHGKKEKLLEKTTSCSSQLWQIQSSERGMPHRDPKQHSCYNAIINTSSPIHWISWQLLSNTGLEIEPGWVAKVHVNLGLPFRHVNDLTQTQHIKFNDLAAMLITQDLLATELCPLELFKL